MSEFTDPEAVAERMHNNPAVTVSVLESILTEQQVTAVELQLMPEPSTDERKQVLREAVRLLKRAGLPEDDAIVAAIRRETELTG